MSDVVFGRNVQTPEVQRKARLRDVREVPEAIGEKLLHAADAMGGGFQRASMDEIARVSGVPRATIYYYFAGRDEILAYVISAALDDLAASFQVVAEGEGTSLERLGELVRCNLDHLQRHRASSELLFANLATAGLVDVTARITDEILGPMQAMLVAGVADGTLRLLEDPALTATALFGALLVVGLQELYLTGAIDVDGVTRRLVPLFLTGLT